jgi:hypothetical protein
MVLYSARSLQFAKPFHVPTPAGLKWLTCTWIVDPTMVPPMSSNPPDEFPQNTVGLVTPGGIGNDTVIGGENTVPLGPNS